MKKNFKEKSKWSWKIYGEDPIELILGVLIYLMFVGFYPYLIILVKLGKHKNSYGWHMKAYLCVLFTTMFLMLFYGWLKGFYLRRVKTKRESVAEPIKASENRLHQHLEKSTPRKDQDDQVIVANGKKEKSLYQRLKEMPYSKDRVGQSFIIVRGGQVGKAGNGDGGGW
ncbi:MAG: hypothetical protein ACPGYF_05190 [Chitinophagales bacterium]